MKAWIVAGVLCALVSAAANASSTGQTLVNWCVSGNEGDRQACQLYITAFIQGVFAATSLGGKLCLPDYLQGKEATDAVKRLLNEKLQRDMAEKLDAQGAAMLLLQQAYPCQKSH